MRVLLTCALTLALLALLTGCASSQRGMPTKGSAPLNHGDTIMSADVKCDEVVKGVRSKLRRASFGSPSETSTLDGARFELPWQVDGEVRRKATVQVTCYGQENKSARVDVDVRAQCRKKDGSWKDCGKSGNLERRVLDELYPLP